MNEVKLNWEELTQKVPAPVPEQEIWNEWLSAVTAIPGKIIVLDDDPTGIQTVHSIPVYTSWDYATLQEIMTDSSKVVYILTNSRALTSAETEELHRYLGSGLNKAANETGTEFLLMSRGDSTLRGHYPLETKTLYRQLSKETAIDGEIIAPFFLEGGRLTWQDVHYIKEGEQLTPAAQTEFAKDATFGYTHSNLREWVVEKTGGEFSEADITSIPLDLLRHREVETIVEILDRVHNFGKVIVNALDYNDLRVFVIALAKAMAHGKRFLFRTAASLVQVIGGIIPRPLLTKDQLYPLGQSGNPGLVIAGSYVQKTTKQLEKLKELSGVDWLEWQVAKAETELMVQEEVNRIIGLVETAFKNGRDVCIYTSRQYHRSDQRSVLSEQNLIFSTRVSDGLVRVVKGLRSRPGFLVAKGGITSSDIGVKGLGAKRAMVLGQIQPGVPVWELGPESRFPGLPYVIFPGNVGTDDTLKKVVETLR